MRLIYPLLLALTLSICALLRVYAQSNPLIGIWEGTLNVSTVELPLRYNIFKDTQDSLCCTMDSPSEGATGIEAQIEHHNDALTISIPNLYITYRGDLEGDSIVGTFTQGAISTPLTLSRVNAPTAPLRTQTPQPPYPYDTEEITFYSDSVPLYGTLTYPIGHKAGDTIGQVIVFVSGSGIQDRDETVMGHKPFAVLADHLARHGIASLRYDDRGYHSDIDSASIAEATTETFATDAQSAITYLRGVGLFDQVGLLGHSEGGTIAFMLAARAIPDFIISMAGSALPGKEVLHQQISNSLENTALSAELQMTYLQAVDTLFDIACKSNLRGEPLVAQVIATGEYQLPLYLLLDLKKVADGISPWLVYFIQYNPAEAIAQIQCPILALNGSLDQQVLAEPHLQAIKQALPPSTPAQVMELKGLNHLFQHATTGAVSEYYHISETISPEVLELITGWLSKL